MKNSLYVVNALTNMHVGSGDVNFGVIDNQVQRDVITDLPTIHSSSLKGALREHFTNATEKITKDHITNIFGSETDSNDTKQGLYRFLSANLLSYPVRSDKKYFYRVTTSDIIGKLLDDCKILGFKLEKKLEKALETLRGLEVPEERVVIFDNENAKLEDFYSEKRDLSSEDISILEDFFGKDIALATPKTFKEFCGKTCLPVIARNQLENGESKNLWYEEVVPRESKFYFFIVEEKANDLKSDNYRDLFEECLEADIIQIGANATIGYGYTKIKKIAGGTNE